MTTIRTISFRSRLQSVEEEDAVEELGVEVAAEDGPQSQLSFLRRRSAGRS